MAKQPRFYPNLPREPSHKKGRRVGAISTRTVVTTPRIIHADRLFKLSSSYEPNYLSVDSKVTQGFNQAFGTKNPGWRMTIASGGDATSSYSREHYSFIPTKYVVRSNSVNWLSKGYGTLSGGLLIVQNDQAALNDAAIGRLRNKLQGKVGNAKLAPPLAESREIHRLVRQINDLGMDALKAMLAAKKSKGKSVSKLVGNIWLGFGFGVNPLLNDIKTSVDSILHYVTRRDGRIVITGAANVEYHSGLPSDSSSEGVAQDAGIAWQISATHQQGIRYVAGIDLKVRGSSSYNVADHLGIKLGELPSTLWELTPFSWVADYGATVGSWLDDMFYTVPGTVLYLSKNYKYQSDTVAVPKAVNTLGSDVVLSGNASIGRYILFQRSKQALAVPVRSLRIKSVDEIAGHGLNKMMNLAGVIAGRHGPRL